MLGGKVSSHGTNGRLHQIHRSSRPADPRTRPRILPQRRNVFQKPMLGKPRRVSAVSATAPPRLSPRQTSWPGESRFATRADPQHCRNGEILGAHRCCGAADQMAGPKRPVYTSISQAITRTKALLLTGVSSSKNSPKVDFLLAPERRSSPDEDSAT
jgi:hypothetical protein